LSLETDRFPDFENARAAHADRVADVEAKHRLVAEFLRKHRFDALLLQKPGNFAWFTSGAENTRGITAELTASLFITESARVVVTNNVDSVELFEEHLPGLGFQLKQRAWHEPQQVLLEDLCRGRTVAGDGSFPGTKNVTPHLNGIRLPLTELEIARMRELGRRLVHSVEATCRNCRPMKTEAELAGEVAHRLVKRRVTPLRIQVAGDGRAERFRHWGYDNEPVHQFASISAVGRWHGLCMGVTRTFCFSEPPEKLRESHHRAVLMLATGAAFSQHEWELCEVWKRVKRIYEKFGVADEWQLDRQAEVIGYGMSEMPLMPKSDFQLVAGMPVFWHPSVGPAPMGDTILVGKSGFEWLTPTENWPRLAVEVKGGLVHCPGLLVVGSFDGGGDEEDDGNASSQFDPASDESGSEYDLSGVFLD
jgi:Xaa-Pro aminopeptidase